jgi:hypothetical protein
MVNTVRRALLVSGAARRAWKLARKTIPPFAMPANSPILCPIEPVCHLEQRNSFLPDDAGMLLKTKERCGKSSGEAGMYMKIKEIRA